MLEAHVSPETVKHPGNGALTSPRRAGPGLRPRLFRRGRPPVPLRTGFRSRDRRTAASARAATGRFAGGRRRRPAGTPPPRRRRPCARRK